MSEIILQRRPGGDKKIGTAVELSKSANTTLKIAAVNKDRHLHDLCSLILERVAADKKLREQILNTIK